MAAATPFLVLISVFMVVLLAVAVIYYRKFSKTEKKYKCLF